MTCNGCVYLRFYESVNDYSRIAVCEAETEEEDGIIIMREVSNFDSSSCLLRRK
ncbi:MAG: hypothetical protein U9Q97_08905 [Acidobacteriota bacterium]|nr:hypothetical protein [Acidobacteriota bacterium]